MNCRLLAILMFFGLPFITWGKVAVPTVDNQLQELPPQSISYSPQDEQAARSILELMDFVKKEELTTENLSQVSHYIENSSNFSHLAPIMKDFLTISTSKPTIAAHRQICSSISRPETVSDPIGAEIKRSMFFYCDLRFLQLLREKKELARLNKKNLNYLLNALPRFLNDKHIPLLSQLLTDLKKNNSLHLFLSQHVSQAIVTSKARPQAQLIDALHMDQRLENYLNSINYFQQADKVQLQRQFVSLSSRLEKAIEKVSFENEKDIASVQTLHAKFISLYQQNAFNISQELAWRHFTMIGKEYRYRGELQKGKELFLLALEISPDEEMSESYFQLIWDDMLNSNWADAHRTIEKYNLIEKFPHLDSKVRFWIAYNMKMMGHLHLARHLYSELIHNSPLTYYSIIGLKELSKLDDQETKDNYLRKIASAPTVLKTKQKHFTPQFLRHLARLRLWADLGIGRFSEKEMNTLASLGRDQIFESNIFRSQLTDREIEQLLIEIVASVMSQNGHHLQTFKLVFNAIGERLYHLDRQTLGYLFPLNYMPEVQKFSQGLDPLFVLSLIRQESAFNPGAKSAVGATGLMQLMPRTAQQFEQELDRTMLESPELNLKIGIQYLRQLLERFDGNMIYALSAYNAGESKVKAWRKNVFTNDNPLMQIESIPYKETRLYVKLIYRNLFFYNFLQENENFRTPIEKSFQLSLNLTNH